MPTNLEIRAAASQLNKDSEILHEAALALERHGANRRVISDVRQRRDEWQDQADEMIRRLPEEGQ